MDTGVHGGLAVVAPISSSLAAVSRAYTRTEFRWHSFPWHGPIVTVV
jgi:hypothetical protein